LVHQLAADRAARAAAVLDDDGEPVLLLERLGVEPRQHVDAAARRERHHQLDGAAWVGGAGGACGAGGEPGAGGKRGGDEAATMHGGVSLLRAREVWHAGSRKAT